LILPQKHLGGKNKRFGGTFEDSIGYVYKEKHVPRCRGKYVEKKAAWSVSGEISMPPPVFTKYYVLTEWLCLSKQVRN